MLINMLTVIDGGFKLYFMMYNRPIFILFPVVSNVTHRVIWNMIKCPQHVTGLEEFPILHVTLNIRSNLSEGVSAL